MNSRVVVVEFPGSSAIEVRDAYKKVLNISVEIVWHDAEILPTCELLVIPGGSSFCDYLRPGALAKTSPISTAIRRYARSGKMLGIGNGFQIMCELGILPGAFLPNSEGKFFNREVFVASQESNLKTGVVFSKVGSFPLACQNGCFYMDRRNLSELELTKQIPFCYSDKDGDILKVAPTGSAGSIAGITNSSGTALGVMFHPERAVEEKYGAAHGREVLMCLLD